MCRYAFKTYKPHFVCFDCRKTFKKPPIIDLIKQNGDWEDYRRIFLEEGYSQHKKFIQENPKLVETLEANYHNRKEKCPQCGVLMANLGLDFRAPKKDKKKEWEILRGMYKIGVNFHTCGCSGIGYIPKKERDYIQYLKDRKADYLDRIRNRDTGLYQENLEEYLNRYTALIQSIDLQLRQYY